MTWCMHHQVASCCTGTSHDGFGTTNHWPCCCQRGQTTLTTPRPLFGFGMCIVPSLGCRMCIVLPCEAPASFEKSVVQCAKTVVNSFAGLTARAIVKETLNHNLQDDVNSVGYFCFYHTRFVLVARERTKSSIKPLNTKRSPDMSLTYLMVLTKKISL